jgi:hypothetical protein
MTFWRQGRRSNADPTIRFGGLDHAGDTVTVDVEEIEAARSPLSAYDSYVSDDHWLFLAMVLAKRDEWPHAVQQPGVRLSSQATYRICTDILPRLDGAALDFTTGAGSLRRTYTAVSDGVVSRTTLELPRALLTPTDATRFRQLLTVFLEQSPVRFGLLAR